MDVKKILLPLDFSEFSEKALEFAIGISTKFDIHLTLLHVVVLFQDDIDESERLEQYEKWIKKQEANVIRQMNSSKDKVKKHGIQVDTEIIRGISAAESILEYIESIKFDIVLIGTHGRTGLKHLFLGSVAEKIVRLSPIPVLTVHRSIHKFQLQKLLVPIDFSPYSQESAEIAISLAKEFNAEIDFLHVIEQEVHPSFYAAGIESIFQIDKDLKDRVIQNLRDFLAEQVHPDLPVNYIVKEGKAHKQIVDISKEKNSDIIIISTHGLTGLDYFLLGSTTEKVVRWANCPVLTVKKKN